MAERGSWVRNLRGDAEILIYLTQDAVPFDADAFANLVAHFEDAEIGAAYGRQLPREKASPIEAHARHFSYPAASRVRSWESRRTTWIQIHLLLKCIWSLPAKRVNERGWIFTGCDLR